MSENNPYSPPSSTVSQAQEHRDFVLHEPRRVGADHGWKWIADGFDYFKQAPSIWILICIIGFVLMIILSLNSFVNFVSSLFSYVWTVGLVMGCKALDDGESLKVSHLFAGFTHKLGSVVLFSLIIAVASGVVMAITMGPSYLEMLQFSLSGDGDPTELAMFTDPLSFLLSLLIALLFIIPLAMCMWFGPVLIVLNDVPIFKAMQLSFKGCLKNFIPFLLYGIIILLLLILAALPIFLGLLIMMPVTFASIYTAYKDIYID